MKGTVARMQQIRQQIIEPRHRRHHAWCGQAIEWRVNIRQQFDKAVLKLGAKQMPKDSDPLLAFGDGTSPDYFEDYLERTFLPSSIIERVKVKKLEPKLPNDGTRLRAASGLLNQRTNKFRRMIHRMPTTYKGRAPIPTHQQNSGNSGHIDKILFAFMVGCLLVCVIGNLFVDHLCEDQEQHDQQPTSKQARFLG